MPPVASSTALLTSAVGTAWDYIQGLFGPTLGAVLSFIVVGGIFALAVGGVGRIFRRK